MPVLLTLVALWLMPSTALAVESPLTDAQVEQIEAEIQEYQAQHVTHARRLNHLEGRIFGLEATLMAYAVTTLTPSQIAHLTSALHAMTRDSQLESPAQDEAARHTYNLLIVILHHHLKQLDSP